MARSCQLKAQVVAADEREETGGRAVLNYGHTFGHALESTSGYGHYLHGEAIAIGMQCAARLAARLGRVDESFITRQTKLLEALELPVAAGQLDADALLAAMQHDKKTEHGRLRFVLPTKLGHVELVEGVSEQDVRARWKVEQSEHFSGLTIASRWVPVLACPAVRERGWTSHPWRPTN